MPLFGSKVIEMINPKILENNYNHIIKENNPSVFYEILDSIEDKDDLNYLITYIEEKFFRENFESIAPLLNTIKNSGIYSLFWNYLQLSLNQLFRKENYLTDTAIEVFKWLYENKIDLNLIDQEVFNYLLSYFESYIRLLLQFGRNSEACRLLFLVISLECDYDSNQIRKIIQLYNHLKDKVNDKDAINNLTKILLELLIAEDTNDNYLPLITDLILELFEQNIFYQFESVVRFFEETYFQYYDKASFDYDEILKIAQLYFIYGTYLLKEKNPYNIVCFRSIISLIDNGTHNLLNYQTNLDQTEIEIIESQKALFKLLRIFIKATYIIAIYEWDHKKREESFIKFKWIAHTIALLDESVLTETELSQLYINLSVSYKRINQEEHLIYLRLALQYPFEDNQLLEDSLNLLEHYNEKSENLDNYIILSKNYRNSDLNDEKKAYIFSKTAKFLKGLSEDELKSLKKEFSEEELDITKYLKWSVESFLNYYNKEGTTNYDTIKLAQFYFELGKHLEENFSSEEAYQNLLRSLLIYYYLDDKRVLVDEEYDDIKNVIKFAISASNSNLYLGEIIIYLFPEEPSDRGPFLLTEVLDRFCLFAESCKFPEDQEYLMEKILEILETLEKIGSGEPDYRIGIAYSYLLGNLDSSHPKFNRKLFYQKALKAYLGDLTFVNVKHIYTNATNLTLCMWEDENYNSDFKELYKTKDFLNQLVHKYDYELKLKDLEFYYNFHLMLQAEGQRDQDVQLLLELRQKMLPMVQNELKSEYLILLIYLDNLIGRCMNKADKYEKAQQYFDESINLYNIYLKLKTPEDNCNFLITTKISHFDDKPYSKKESEVGTDTLNLIIADSYLRRSSLFSSKNKKIDYDPAYLIKAREYLQKFENSENFTETSDYKELLNEYYDRATTCLNLHFKDRTFQKYYDLIEFFEEVYEYLENFDLSSLKTSYQKLVYKSIMINCLDILEELKLYQLNYDFLDEILKFYELQIELTLNDEQLIRIFEDKQEKLYKIIHNL